MQRYITNRPPSVVSRSDQAILPSIEIVPPLAANDNERWLNEKQTAELLNVSVKWLQKMRYTGGGIPFYKFGDKMVRYKMSEIFLYCEKNSHQNTSQ